MTSAAFPDWLWAPGLVACALRCGTDFLSSFGILAAMLGGALLVAGRIRSRGSLVGLLVLLGFCAVAWFQRDRHHILGDARLWIDWAHAYGFGIPAYNELIPTRLYGLAGNLFDSKEDIIRFLATLSILCGIASALILFGYLRRRNEGEISNTILLFTASVLTFLQPMSFVFYGHIESYGLFAAGLCLFLLVLEGDTKRGSYFRSILAAALLGTIHTMAALLIPPLIAQWCRSRGRTARTSLLVFGGLTVLMIATVASVPSLRSFTIFANQWKLHFSPAYLAGVLNVWLLVLLTPGLLMMSRDLVDREPGDTDTFFGLALGSYLLLPFLVTLNLGAYSDSSLLTPAFAIATFFVASRLRRLSPRTIPAFAARLLPGVLLLAAWLTLTHCPAGLDLYERQIPGGSLPRIGKVYSYEILSYYLRDRGDIRGGIEKLEKAVQAEPGNKRLWGPIGLAQLQAGDTATAITNLEKAMESPRADRYVSHLAEALVRSGQPRRAVTLLEKNHEAAIADGSRSAALGVAYMRLNHPDSTLLVSKQRLERVPCDPVAHHNAAVALIQLNQPYEALEAFKLAARCDPENLMYPTRVIQLMVALEGPESASKYLGELPPRVAAALRQRMGGR